MIKKCKVVPKENRFISGLLPHNERIDKPTELNLNTRELLRCMQYGSVYEVLSDGQAVHIHTENFKTDNEPTKPPTPPSENNVAGIGIGMIGFAEVS